ncbi:MAG: hypothetical protein NDF54_07490 [archaeon GB-1867-035]|nr:hypothetical protein [Candidatus Culexmicrobium profundum]
MVVSFCDFISFLNGFEVDELRDCIDELEDKVDEVLRMSGAYIDEKIVSGLRDADPEFYFWFCFLRANFLRGRITIANKAFIRFLEYAEKLNYYYFDGFPEGRIIPNIGFRYAGKIEKVLDQLRDEYGSGCNFVKFIRQVIDQCDDNYPLIYLELTSKLVGLRNIGSKIANAIIGEVSWELSLLRKYELFDVFERLVNTLWIRRLIFSSFFNVMIDAHVRNFFKKFKLENVEHSHLIFIASQVKEPIIEMLFYRYFDWVKEEDRSRLLKDYRDYIGANLIEKMIWLIYFVKSNIRKLNMNLSDLRLFRIASVIFS